MMAEVSRESGTSTKEIFLAALEGADQETLLAYIREQIKRDVAAGLVSPSDALDAPTSVEED